MDKKELDQLKNAMLDLKKGNISALETVYTLTRKGVFSFVFPIMHTKERAEDVMQQTYIQLFEKIDLYDKKKNPLNWILTMAKNLALTEIGKDGREISTDFVEPMNGDRVFTYDNHDFDTPIFDVAKKELDETELQIVMLFVIGEYKHREIAEMLNMPLGTVTWKYNAAIKKLRSALKAKGFDQE